MSPGVKLVDEAGRRFGFAHLVECFTSGSRMFPRIRDCTPY